MSDLSPVENESSENDELLGDSSHALLDPGSLWRLLEQRIFGTAQFFRLWLAQVTTATGDWLFFFAITFTAARLGGDAAASVGFVVAARIVPGLFLSQVAGVLADRWDRRKLMVTTDLARAAVVLSFPFLDHVWQLVAMSLVLEVFTMLWIPAKEASVPNLVPKDHLTTANSLAVFATYGSVLLAAGLFFAMTPGAERLAEVEWLGFLQITQESLSFYVNSLSFVVSALLISSLVLPSQVPDSKSVADDKLQVGAAWEEFKEGWTLIASDPTVKAVNIGLATAMIGGGMIIPLGSVYVELVGAGLRGFTSMGVALGAGAALGVLALSLAQRRIDKHVTFVAGVFGAGVSLFVAASLNSLAGLVFGLLALGIFAAPVYVTGFTLLHETVSDAMRGRVFSSLYYLMRVCVAVALLAGPFFSVALGRLSDWAVDGDVAGYPVPGVRITLWLASLVILGAGFAASRAMGRTRRPMLRSVDS